jgi:anti-anti-sigma factor
MTTKKRNVAVHQLPVKVATSEERAFLCNLQKDMNAERPLLVLDCSKLRSMNIPSVRLLLSCLEMAMKRNGDVRLASVPASLVTSSQFTGLYRLFEMYATPAEAVESFNTRLMSLVPRALHENVVPSDSRYAA